MIPYVQAGKYSLLGEGLNISYSVPKGKFSCLSLWSFFRCQPFRKCWLIGQSLTPLGRISLRGRIATLKSHVCLWSYFLFWLFHLVSADKWLVYRIQGSGEAVLGWRSPACYGAATACLAVSTARGDFPFGFCSLCSPSSGWRSHKEKQGKW